MPLVTRNTVKPSVNAVTQIRCCRCGLGPSFGRLVRLSPSRWYHAECPRDFKEYMRKKEVIIRTRRSMPNVDTEGTEGGEL